MKNLEKFKNESLELTKMLNITGGTEDNSNLLPGVDDDFSCDSLKDPTQTTWGDDMKYTQVNDDGVSCNVMIAA